MLRERFALDLAGGVLADSAHMARLVVEHLKKAFPGGRGAEVRALEGLSLTAESGELLVLTGPSGCGKTTTLRLIAGLETPDGGIISLGGRDLTKLPPQEREVAMVFQQLALYPHLTVRENLGFGLMLRKVAKAEAWPRVEQAAAALELAGCLDRLPETLSGGQRQRVALGRAMVQRPKLFLLDEPLAHLDAPMRTQMRREITRWQRQLGATMVYVTHDQTEAMAMAGRLAVMRDGAVQQTGKPQEIYDRPANRFVAGFIGSPAMNFVRGRIGSRGDHIAFEAGEGFSWRIPAALAEEIEMPAGTEMEMGLRPQHLKLLPNGGALPGTVELTEPSGAETYVTVRVGAHSLVVRADAETGLVPGARTGLDIVPDRISFFDSQTGASVRKLVP